MARQRWAVGAGVLLGLLVLAIAGRADEAAAVRAIEKLGGTVTRDDNLPGKPIVGVSLSKTNVTDLELKELKELTSLRELSLATTKITDAGLEQLKQLKSMKLLVGHPSSFDR